MKRLLLISLSCLSSSFALGASTKVAAPEPVKASSAKDAHGESDHGSGHPSPELAATVEEYKELARRAVTNGDYENADTYFRQALARPVAAALKEETLIEYGRFLEEKAGKKSKAAAVYEQVLSLFPSTPATPDLSLRLGRIQRDLGAFKSALNRFYNVLHATLRVQNGEEYQSLVQRAQFEIAQTHFTLGEYAAAGKFFSRLKLLDLKDDIRSEVHFKSAYLLYLGKDYPGALTNAREYLNEFAGDASAPEAQYLVIRSLRELGREEEALQETVKLLRSGREHGKDHPKVWAYWQQKTGSELATDFYKKANYLNALTIYQRLAEISAEPETRWPAVYQIGLCFEHLRHFDRALEAFQFIAKAAATAEKTQGTPPKPAGVNLDIIREMAQWRSNHLKWLADTDRELTALLNRKSAAPLEGAGFMVNPELRQSSSAQEPPLTAVR